MKDIIYEISGEKSASDLAYEKAGALFGLAKMGVAASDTAMNMDLHRSGFQQTFETMARLAHDLFLDLDGLEDRDETQPPISALEEATKSEVPEEAKGQAASTPILELFRQHQAIIGAAQTYQTTATGKAEDEELELLFYQHSSKIEEEMMAQPSTCAADFAAKAIVDSCKGGLLSDWETSAFWKEARQLIKSAA